MRSAVVTQVLSCVFLVRCTTVISDAVPDKAAAIQIARDECSYEAENWRNVMLSGDHWILLSDRLREAWIDKRDGTVTACFSPGGIVAGQ